MRTSVPARVSPALALLVLACSQAAAQGPARFAHARVEARNAAAAGGLEAALRTPASAGQPVWFAYAVPSPIQRRIQSGGEHGRSSHGQCSLETGSSWVNVSDGDEDGSSGVLVFFRFEPGAPGPTRLRIFSEDCTVDAEGSAASASIIWLDGVRPVESVAYLEKLSSQADGHDRDGISVNRILLGIALHDDPSADAALGRFASPPQPVAVRKKAAFWLGDARGAAGHDALRRMASSDPDEEVRKSVTFALSQSPVPEAVDTLIAMARSDASSRVRGQALFWLAHKAGRRGAEAIADAIRDDPETEVKRKAVFALTQLPPDESVTQLIRVARTNRNPEVRKQAFFWLGQSKDPRALAYIEEVLTK